MPRTSAVADNNNDDFSTLRLSDEQGNHEEFLLLVLGERPGEELVSASTVGTETALCVMPFLS